VRKGHILRVPGLSGKSKPIKSPPPETSTIMMGRHLASGTGRAYALLVEHELAAILTFYGLSDFRISRPATSQYFFTIPSELAPYGSATPNV
jgi:hypothetical protein